MADDTRDKAKQATKAKERVSFRKGNALFDETSCGNKHQWVQWTEYVKHCKKYRCEREGCGFFKKCWATCEDIDCKGCHVPAHKRW